MRAASFAVEDAPTDAPSLAVVDLALPPPEVRLAFARQLLGGFARRALADLGLIPVDDPQPDPGIARGNRALHADRYPNGARSDGTEAGKVDAQ